jgi:N-methylhydantoinase A/oxoprolinase/acetone carboxylase beta subunit
VGERRIGVDVGGTNTDAVLVEVDGTVLARAKVPTTDDPSDGIAAALAAVTPGDGGVRSVALGTTHGLNAILQRRGLRRVFVLRLGAPGTLAVPPLAGWSADLVAAISAGATVVRGGVEVDGRATPVDADAICRAVEGATAAAAVAITGTFSPLDPSQEHEAAAIVASVTAAPCSLGHEIGGLGLREREHATVLNAAIGGVLDDVIAGLERAAERLGARAYLTQNDGSLMAPVLAHRLPVLTLGSGPSNSLRGAATLTGLTDVLVADVGGTSTDVGALANGFARESAVGVTIGGVVTNFRMPDVVSVAAGGGTHVGVDGALGIESVGRRLTTEALVFGGPVATLTDAGVAGGRARIGDPSLVVGRDDLTVALAAADARVADAVDRMRLGPDDADLVLVGGGAALIGDDLPGVRCVHRPADANVANAIGAALAPVAGEADVVAEVGGDRRAEALEACLDTARRRAIEAGADPDRLETVWIDEVPLAYLDRPVSRLRAKVAGPPAPDERAGPVRSRR